MSDSQNSAEKQLLKQLLTKKNTCKRIAKEYSLYQEEAFDNQVKHDAMASAQAEFYELKKQKEIMDESHMMVKDCKLRLAKAKQDLQYFLDTHQAAVSTHPDYLEGRHLLLDQNASQ